MKELIVATKNKGKLTEIKEFLKEFDIKITSLCDYPKHPEIIEDGKTFRSNAIKKAITIAKYTNKLVMGEDSGLEVKALDNKPGIFSARFSGRGADDKKNNAKLLRMLRGIPAKKRQARYRCLAALADQRGLIAVVSGTCSGLIAERSSGSNGFGYDPLFLVPGYNKTFGKLDPKIKSKISHRFKALKKVKKILKKYLGSAKRSRKQS